MPIKFKLVGQTTNKKYYEITDDFAGPVNLNLLQELFKFHGVSSEDIEKIRFITDSEQIKNSDKSYNVNPDEDRGIFVFTSETEIRNKLQDIFMKNGKEVDVQQQKSPQQNASQHVAQHVAQPGAQNASQHVAQHVEQFQPLTIKESVEPVMTPEIIETMNKRTLELFSQPNFKILLNIFLTNPGIIRDFSKYVQHCDIVSSSKEANWDELSAEKQTEYNMLADNLEKYHLGKPRELLLSRLVKYSGHLNLTLRSILSE
jgi:hypothetical protein